VGCWFAAGAAAAGATVAYVKGEGKKAYNHDVRTVYDAALESVEDMGLAIGEKSVDDTSGVIKARQADGDNVNINIERITETSSEAKIRIGTFGDESETRMIFSEMDKRL
jgi:hypothetical protein